MSFWSSLNLIRAAPPPIVSVASVGRFVRALEKAGAFGADEQPMCQIKYGKRVDADERSTDDIELDDTGIVARVVEYPWDHTEMYSSHADLADALEVDAGKVYRAFLMLGSSSNDIVNALTRKPTKENKDELCLYSLSLSVGPALIAGLDSEAPAMAGWMRLKFSGPGYFFPWTYREARERAESVGLIRRIAAACRSVWPVPQSTATAATVAGRQRLGNLWLYDDLSLPPDWLWFVSESG